MSVLIFVRVSGETRRQRSPSPQELDPGPKLIRTPGEVKKMRVQVLTRAFVWSPVVAPKWSLTSPRRKKRSESHQEDEPV